MTTPVTHTTHKAHFLFVVSVVMKAATGVLETLGSILLFSTSGLSKLVIFLTERELGEDPGDFIANHVREFLPYVSVSTQLFAAWYFLIHGAVNLTLAIGLLRKKLWCYPAAITAHILFIMYQLYRFSYTHAPTLIVLTIFDVIVVMLIWREHRFLHSTKNEVLALESK